MIHQPTSHMELFVPTEWTTATHFPYPAFGRPKYYLPIERIAARASRFFFLSTWRRHKLNAAHLISSFFTHRDKIAFRESDWVTDLKTFAGCKTAIIAVSVGTPGPYTKSTVLLLDEKLSPLSVCKIAFTKSAVFLLENEWLWLNTLSKCSRLHDYLPTPVSAQSFGQGYAIIQSPCTGSLAGHFLNKRILTFLAELQDSTGTVSRFSDSVMYKKLLVRIEKLQGSMTAKWQARAAKTFRLLERGFLDRPINMCVAHRDFVPWNIRVKNAKVFVFDWEYASSGYLPLYDVFHFMLFPIALRSEVSCQKLGKVCKNIETISKKEFPAGASVLAAHQLLAYMLDLSLLYLDANNGQDAEDRILAQYAKLIDLFDTWRTG